MKITLIIPAFLFAFLYPLHACDNPIDKIMNPGAEFSAAFEKSGKETAIVVLKKQKKLLLVSKDMCVISQYPVATGSNPGRKTYMGDNATPEGIYRITQVNSAVIPGRIAALEQEVKAMPDNKEALKKKEELRLLKKEFRRGESAINAMNAVYLHAKDGHAKYGTNEDLGLNSYGPAFLRLDYPNEADREHRKKLIKEKKIPILADGTPKGAGSGIAIHGTNDPASLGHDASSGCVRMDNEGLIKILEYAEKGTIVMIKGE